MPSFVRMAFSSVLVWWKPDVKLLSDNASNNPAWNGPFVGLMLLLLYADRGRTHGFSPDRRQAGDDPSSIGGDG